MLVVDGKATVDIGDRYGWTPLHTAAERGRFDVAHFLLDKGARPEVGNNECVAPIDLAASPLDDYTRVPIAPDTGLLCRMIRESGADFF